MADKGFRVDTDKLKLVADQIDALVKDLDGTHGRYPGNFPDFQQNASEQKLASALAPFWAGDGMDVFAQAYHYVYQGITDIYSNLKGQLDALHTACTTTVSTYGDSDKNAKKNVTGNGTYAGGT